jgi:hypothetical protein
MADDENTFNASEASGMIPSFSGKEGSFWKFIQMADEAFEDVTSETDKKKFYRVILTKLEGSAFDSARACSSSEWEAIREVLLGKYGNSRGAAELLAELAKARQTSSVLAFGESIQKWMAQLRDALEAEFDEVVAEAAFTAHSAFALQSFVDGLRPELGAMVRAKAPTSLDEAIKAARSEELARNRCHWTPSNSSKTANHSSHPQKTEPPKDVFQKFREQTVKLEPGGCTYCKAPDHSITQCPDPKCKLSKFATGTSRVNVLQRTEERPKRKRRSTTANLRQQVKELTEQLSSRSTPGPSLQPPSLFSLPPPSGLPAQFSYLHSGNGKTPAAPGHAGATR